MAKYINTDSAARQKLIKGIDTVADIVKTTLGPCGSNVILKKAYNTPTIINDGVSIAREIVLEDPTENAGAILLTSAASATNSGSY
jgi:chaperonin GroEL